MAVMDLDGPEYLTPVNQDANYGALILHFQCWGTAKQGLLAMVKND